MLGVPHLPEPITLFIGQLRNETAEVLPQRLYVHIFQSDRVYIINRVHEMSSLVFCFGPLAEIVDLSCVHFLFDCLYIVKADWQKIYIFIRSA